MPYIIISAGKINDDTTYLGCPEKRVLIALKVSCANADGRVNTAVCRQSLSIKSSTSTESPAKC